MPTYLCRWPNGDVSIVTGRTRLDIDFVLDQVGNPDDALLTPIRHAIAVHFRLNEQGDGAESITECLELEGFDEHSQADLGGAYPVLSKALLRDDATDEELSAAIRAEKERLWDSEPVQEIPSDLKTAKLQRIMDLPRSIAEDAKKRASRHSDRED